MDKGDIVLVTKGTYKNYKVETRYHSIEPELARIKRESIIRILCTALMRKLKDGAK